MSPAFQVLAPDSPLHEAALDHTYPLWHDSLTRADYGRYNRAQLRTAWGAAHLERVGLVADGVLLSSAKRYRLRVRVDGRPVDAVGIGAVFTPPHLRSRGHAAALIERIVEVGRSEGAAVAMLFSEIAPRYYEHLGFSVVPMQQATIGVRARPGAPAVLVRAGDARDLPFMAEMHSERSARYRFALEHDPDWLQYTLVKKRLLSGLGAPGARDVEFFVCEEGTRAVAWLLLQVVRGRGDADRESWSIASCGDRDPSGARIGAVLQSLIARTPAARPPSIQAWWPARLDPVQLVVHRRPVSGTILMTRPLRDEGRIDPPLTGDEVLYWHADAF
jgi:GNAT superfamily N-acetyltransferase